MKVLETCPKPCAEPKKPEKARESGLDFLNRQQPGTLLRAKGGCTTWLRATSDAGGKKVMVSMGSGTVYNLAQNFTATPGDEWEVLSDAAIVINP